MQEHDSDKTTTGAAQGMRKGRATPGDYIRIARPDHWIKNLFIIPGFFLAVVLTGAPASIGEVARLALALVATSLVASANYVINEWLDAKFDKFHPVKKDRPVVAHDVKASWVYAEYAALAVLGILASIPLGSGFLAMAVWLLAMGVAYNVEPMRTKDVPFLDVLSESVNNMIRLLMGWFVIASDKIPPCSIIIGYWMCGAFLMATKRFAEYRMIGDPERAGLYRRSFRLYSEKSLIASAFCYAIIATFLVGVFLVKYKIEFLVSMPFLIALFTLYIAIAYKNDSAAQKPEKLYREKWLMLLSAIFVISLIVACVAHMPWLSVLTSTDLITLP